MSQRADEPSDEQLMGNLAGPRVEVAVSKLYDRYSRTVFGVGLKIPSDRSMAEELVHKVFLKMWRSSGTFDSARGSYSTRLHRVTRSVALDLYRKRAHRIRQVSDGQLHIAAEWDSSAGPPELVDESWLSWPVSRALEVLDAPHREVIDLAYFGGCPKESYPSGKVCPWAPSRPARRALTRACARSLWPTTPRGRS
jgi:RNA polymerase sigma factor (sigma-70 family)